MAEDVPDKLQANDHASQKENSGLPSGWPSRWTLILSVTGSIVVGVVANFLTDYVKDWLSAYSDRIRESRLHSLQADLDLIQRCHDSIAYYLSYVMDSLFSASIFTVSSGIMSALYIFSVSLRFWNRDGLMIVSRSKDVVEVARQSDPERRARERFWDRIQFLVGMLYGSFFIITSLAALTYYFDALNIIHQVRDFDDSKAAILAKLRELEQVPKH